MSQESTASGQAQSMQQGDTLSEASAEQIKQLQRELAARGLYQGGVDGIVGPKTRAALRNFQVQQGIATNGLNQETADALGLDLERQPVSGTEQGSTAAGVRQPGTEQQSEGVREAERSTQAGSVRSSSAGLELSTLSAEQIKQVQQFLQEVGYYRGEVDGVVGAQTRGGLQRFFQNQAQLAAQGKIGEPAAGMFGIQMSD